MRHKRQRDYGPRQGLAGPGPAQTREQLSLAKTSLATAQANQAAAEKILPYHISEAIQFRSLDRQLWGWSPAKHHKRPVKKT